MMTNEIARFFQYDHLPPGPMAAISAEVCALAFSLDAQLPDSAEKSAGMRKLLEAKDCFVRAALDNK